MSGSGSHEIDRDDPSAVSIVDAVLEPFDRMLKAQESFRKKIGVKRVDKPTYERYIIGPVERFDRRMNAFLRLNTDNPYAYDFPEKYKAKTGFERWEEGVPLNTLDPEGRIARSLTAAVWRLCREYHLTPLPVSASDSQVPVHNKAWMSRLIKKVALFLGVQIVGIAKVDQRWVYKDVDIPEKYVIVVGVRHHPTLIQTAPSFMSGAAVGNTYAKLKYISTQIADFIRAMGYPATYRETLGWSPEMLVVPTAIDAGIGEFARNGRVLSPEFGINMRLKPITTDLPLEVDKPISFGVHDFCMVCEKCARRCPAQAIPYGPPTDKPLNVSNASGYQKWYVDAEKCLTFWGVNKKKWDTCGGRCIAVCPWNKPKGGIHDLVRWTAINLGSQAKQAIVKIDELLSYGKRIPLELNAH